MHETNKNREEWDRLNKNRQGYNGMNMNIWNGKENKE